MVVGYRLGNVLKDKTERSVPMKNSTGHVYVMLTEAHVILLKFKDYKT